MLKAIVIGSSSAVFYGLTGGMIGSFIFGTASLPFIVMSSLGFVIGVTRWYGVAVTQALLQLDRFPALLRLHMDANYPSERFRYKPLEYFQRNEFKSSWRMQSMLVTGWLTAQGAIDVSLDGTAAPQKHTKMTRRKYMQPKSRLLLRKPHRRL